MTTTYLINISVTELKRYLFFKGYFLYLPVNAYILISIFLVSGCRKYVAVDPPITLTTGASVYETDASAASVLTGLYTNFSKGSFASGAFSVSLLSGLSADEFKLSSAVSNTDRLFYYYTNSLFSNFSVSFGTENWAVYYRYIYTCNEAIEGINASNTLSSAVKQQLLGEAKFVRAFLYFYLVNLYGSIPLTTTTDYDLNSRLARTSVSEIYQQIKSDLIEARGLLADYYVSFDGVSNTSARTRPSKWAAIALLSRAYLYSGDYANAELEASVLIKNSSLFTLDTDLNNVFLANSNEAIWQLQPVNSGWNTEDARYFVINSAPGTSKPISISSSLYNSFEVGDNRKTNWIRDTTINGIFLPYPFKYKRAKRNDPVTEFLMVLRLAEQYLIRAEAKAKQNKYVEAIDDVNILRLQHGGLSNPLPAPTDQATALDIIVHERQVELFSEWGHRWLDLKRTAKIDEIMTQASVHKGGSWQSYQQLYPILYSDIQKDQNITQNPGYN